MNYKYLVELNYPFDYNVESGLYNEDVFVVEGNIGDIDIIIETNLKPEQLLNNCYVDIKQIIK